MHNAESNPCQPMPESPIAPPRLPAAAAQSTRATPPGADPPDAATRSLFLLTTISAADGTLALLAASGHLNTLGGAIAVGLTVIAGAGTWLAARQAFTGRRLTPRDHLTLAGLGIATLASATAATWLGLTLSQTLTLHVLPKAAGIILFLIAAEIGGLHLPRPPALPRAVPLPVAALAIALLAEVLAQWTP